MKGARHVGILVILALLIVLLAFVPVLTGNSIFDWFFDESSEGEGSNDALFDEESVPSSADVSLRPDVFPDALVGYECSSPGATCVVEALGRAGICGTNGFCEIGEGDRCYVKQDYFKDEFPSGSSKGPDRSFKEAMDAAKAECEREIGSINRKRTAYETEMDELCTKTDIPTGRRLANGQYETYSCFCTKGSEVWKGNDCSVDKQTCQDINGTDICEYAVVNGEIDPTTKNCRKNPAPYTDPSRDRYTCNYPKMSLFQVFECVERVGVPLGSPA